MNLFNRPVFTASLGVRLLSLSLGFSAFYASAVNAQTYPSKPIKAIVPFAAGSATDQIARAFAAKMSDLLEQPVVVENKAGASGIIGVDAVAERMSYGAYILLAALIGLQQSGVAVQPRATLRLAVTLQLQALPLMLLLFVFFPRLGPLWSLPADALGGRLVAAAQLAHHAVGIDEGPDLGLSSTAGTGSHHPACQPRAAHAAAAGVGRHGCQPLTGGVIALVKDRSVIHRGRLS